MAETQLQLTINGEPQTLILREPSVPALLDALDIQQVRGLAIAIGDRVIPRSAWEETILEDGQAIEIIRATQGG
jgi:sulfur carrier protein